LKLNAKVYGMTTVAELLCVEMTIDPELEAGLDGR
jgi:hypothetical protein